VNRRSALGLLASTPLALTARAGEGNFAEGPAPRCAVLAEPSALASVAADLLRWMEANPTDPALAVPVLGGVGSWAQLRATLAWIATTARAEPQRLEDPLFLSQHLQFRRWVPDREAAAARGVSLGPSEIRLTKYLAWRADGRRTRERGFDCALYAVPADDALRLRFTRREVLDGAYEPGGSAAGQARPLVWLPRAGVHEALLQGTVVVAFPDGTSATLNVHQNNGMAWNPAFAREPERQDRLWYFREVSGLLGYGTDDKVALQPRVSVAGDVESLGLGGLFALAWGEGSAERMRLVLLADTGGAFRPNLFQLDWLVGTFATKAAFEVEAAAMPDRVRAWALALRTPVY
jgi:hypothetical protein